MADARLIQKKYRVIGRLGGGGMGVVYEVEHINTRRHFAIKILKLGLEDDPQIKRRFEKEALTLGGLQHENIVEVFDIDYEAEFGAYMIMELIKGLNLRQVIDQQGRLDFAEVARIGTSIANALDYAHSNNVIHRDIKPANILIEDKTRRVVVTDFGIAKQMEGDADESMTGTGGFIGTYRYSSLEQIRTDLKLGIDGRADIYSLGAVLYEMYAGRKYLSDVPEAQIPYLVGSDPTFRPRLEFPDPPPEEFVALLAACLARDRDERLASAGMIAQRLGECMRAYGSVERVQVAKRERSSALTIKEEFDRLGADDVDVTAATQAITEADALMATGVAEQAAEKYREAVDHYQRAIEQAERERQTKFQEAIEALRADVGARAAAIDALHAELGALGVVVPDDEQVGDIDQHLRAINQVAQSGDLQGAMDRLQALQDRLTDLARKAELGLQAAVAARRDELAETWRAFADDAGDYLPADQTKQFEQLIGAIEPLRQAGDWAGCRERLTTSRARLEEARRSATAAAEDEVGALFERAAVIVQDLERREAGDEAAALGLSAAQDRVAAEIGQGRLRSAVAAAQEAARAAEASLQRVEQTERERAAAARAAAEQQLAQIAPASRPLAEEEVRHAQQAVAQGNEAEGRGEYRTARRHYEDASAAAATAAALISRKLSAQLDEATRDLRELIEQASQAPEQVVGATRAGAIEAIETQHPDIASALAAIQQARARLAETLDESTVFIAADENRRAAEAYAEKTRKLPLARRELAAAERLMEEATTALRRRDWAGARDGYAKAVDAFSTLERDAELQAEKRHAAEQRAAVDARLAGVDDEIARAAAADAWETVRQAAEAGHRAEQRGAYGDAVAHFESALASLPGVENAVARDLAAGVARSQEALRAVIERGAEAPADLVGVALEHARGLAGEQPATRAAVAAIDAARQSLATVLEQVPAYERALAQRAAASTRAREVRALQPAATELRPLEEILGAAEQAFEGQDWAAAADRFERSVAACNVLEQELRTRQQLAAATRAREAVETLVASIDSQVASIAAEQILAREAAPAMEAAREAERGGDYEEAVRRYGAARDAYEKVRQQVAAYKLQLVAAAQTELGRLALEHAATAPAEIVGEALAETQRQLALRDPADPDAALQSIQAARQRLEAKLDEAAIFTAASQRRDLAAEREHAVTALKPSSRQRKAADRQMKDGAAAMKRRQWAAARDAYAKAAEEFAALEQTLSAQRAEADRRAAAVPQDVTREVPKRTGLDWRIGAVTAVVLVVGATVTYQFTRSPSGTEIAKGERPPLARPAPQEPRDAGAPIKEGGDAKGADAGVAKGNDSAANRAPAPAKPRVSFGPSNETMKVKEGTKLAFNFAVEGETADDAGIQWKLNNQPVAEKVERWTNESGFAAAGAPYTVEALVGSGRAKGESRKWTVNINHPPRIAASPKPGRVDAKAGDTVTLKVDAADEDGDALHYAWKLDGKNAGADRPEFAVPGGSDHTVALEVSDGQESTPAKWQMAKAELPVFKPEFLPRQLERVTYGKPVVFSIGLPADVPAAAAKYSWKLDGKEVASTKGFTLSDFAPTLVRSGPVTIGADVRDDQGRVASHEWKVTVVPPVPQISGFTPRNEAPLELSAGEAQTFEIKAGAPVGGQALTYVFKVDGKDAARSSTASFQFKADDAAHEVAATVEDNYKQVASREPIRWRLQGTVNVERKVRDWLGAYEQAWNARDASTLGSLRGLGADQVAKLADSFKGKKDFRVAFSGVKVDKLDATQAKASYRRSDSWVSENDDSPQSRITDVEQVFQLSGGAVKEVKVTQKPVQ